MATTQKASAAPAAPVAGKGPFVHQLTLYLVGGQQFTLNEMSANEKIPPNVVAFINAWREGKNVWHSPNNDPHFGVRVKDVSLYEYRVGRFGAAEKKEEAAPAASPAPEAAAEAAPAKKPVRRRTTKTAAKDE